VKIWAERSPEIAALFNPAFCGVLLYSAINGFSGSKRHGMQYELSFLILPFVLHGPTRESMPKTIATPFHTWVNGTSILRIGLAERVRAATPLTRESIMFMMSRQCISLQGERLFVGPKKPKLSSKKIAKVDDVRHAVQAATTLGRLLAGAGTPATIYASVGIAP
jgi:hypothetical protein